MEAHSHSSYTQTKSKKQDKPPEKGKNKLFCSKPCLRLISISISPCQAEKANRDYSFSPLHSQTTQATEQPSQQLFPSTPRCAGGFDPGSTQPSESSPVDFSRHQLWPAESCPSAVWDTRNWGLGVRWQLQVCLAGVTRWWTGASLALLLSFAVAQI